MVDTPTRLVNFSNEFLPKKKKLNTDKLKQKPISNVKKFTDLEQLSDIEKSQKSTGRKKEHENRENLLKIFNDVSVDLKQ